MQTGEVSAEAAGLDVKFSGENGGGDGLRREWFDMTFRELIDPSTGLFVSKDGGRNFMPMPSSESAVANAQYLAYFALLGRLIGLALFHVRHRAMRPVPLPTPPPVLPRPSYHPPRTALTPPVHSLRAVCVTAG
jgi:hypothetical protein